MTHLRVQDWPVQRQRSVLARIADAQHLDLTFALERELEDTALLEETEDELTDEQLMSDEDDDVFELPEGDRDAPEPRPLTASVLSPLTLSTSADELEFLDQLQHVLGRALVGYAKKFSYPYTSEEALGLLWELVCGADSNGRRSFAASAAVAENPWGFIVRSAKRRFHKEMGHRSLELDALPDVFSGRHDVEAEIVAKVGMDVATSRSADVLAKRTPLHLVDDVRQLVVWLAHNPPQRRSYTQPELTHAHRTFSVLTPQQIAAVSNVTWGARPTQAETSLFAGFLTEEDFNPATCAQRDTLLPALRRYKQKMYRIAA